ncbi:ferredoxin reductase [soil metagenome]
MGTVASARAETPSGRSIWIDVPGWPGNIAGQHVDVRLTAPDGYQATRSYSLASSGPEPRVQLAVDRLPDGEVSPYLVDDLQAGDMLELRGPLGGWFVWAPEVAEPVQLIAGGSGVVPLVAMIRAHAASGSAVPMQLLYSVRMPDDRFFADELDQLPNVTYAYTRSGPPDATIGRLTRDRLAAAVLPPGAAVYVCGPTGFVEAVASWLVELGHDASSIKTERFGGA